MRNFQRDGVMRMAVPTGRVAYEPNSLAPDGPREDPRRGFVSHPETPGGTKLRARADSFADHYSQARMFWESMMPPEQAHIAAAFAFELGKVETPAIRRRMLGHLGLVKGELAERVAARLGMSAKGDAIAAAVAPVDLAPSPALSLLAKAEPTLEGRRIGVLVGEGVDAQLLAALRRTAKAEGCDVAIVAPTIAGVTAGDGAAVAADHALESAPSVLFDAVVVAPGDDSGGSMADDPDAVAWIRDAFAHLKAIGHVESAASAFAKAGVDRAADEGVRAVDGREGLKAFFAAARRHRIWSREQAVRPPPRQRRD